jgi:hypothetical protein
MYVFKHLALNKDSNMAKEAWNRFQATCEKGSSCFIFHLSTNNFVDKLEKHVSDKSKEEEVFPEDNHARHDL